MTTAELVNLEIATLEPLKRDADKLYNDIKSAKLGGTLSIARDLCHAFELRLNRLYSLKKRLEENN